MKTIVCDKCGKVMLLPFMKFPPPEMYELIGGPDGGLTLGLCVECGHELIEAVRKARDEEWRG